MKVLYDHQIFDSQSIGGISRYVYELIRFFDKEFSTEWELALVHSDNEYIKTLPMYKLLLPKKSVDNKSAEFLWNINFKGKSRLYNLQNKLLLRDNTNSIAINKAKSIEKIKEGNFDIFHPTYYDNYFLDFIADKPFVLTIHDLIHQIFPEYGLYENVDKNQRMIDRANRIITVSHNTKKDLINIFEVDEKKIDVIYLANPLDNLYDSVDSNFSNKIPEKYFLFVGGRDGYKNFMFFVQMFSRLKPAENNLYILCTGSKFTDAEKYLFKKLNIENQILCYFLSDAELFFLYSNAIALVFPSLYEGFGLPVLEAFSCNCLVVLSNSSSLAEIGDSAVLKFEPKDPMSLLNCLKLVLDKSFEKEAYIENGKIRLKDFSWTLMGEKTLETYKKVLSN